jgi:hypothetical protein
MKVGMLFRQKSVAALPCVRRQARRPILPPVFGTGRIAHDPILHSGTAETHEAADDRRSCARPGEGPHDAWSQHPPAGAGWLYQDRTCRVGSPSQGTPPDQGR